MADLPAYNLEKIIFVREQDEMNATAEKVGCKPTLEVLAWLMAQVNAKNNTLMIGYGGLIHIHREKSFVKKSGRFFDDDIDLWSSYDTLEQINQLEPELYHRFGFTIRFFVNKSGFVTLAQLAPVCDINIMDRTANKGMIGKPRLEVYLLEVIPVNNSRWAKVLWQGSMFPESYLYPPKHLEFQTLASSDMTAKKIKLNLQLPPGDLQVLSCLYGNWIIPSAKHAEKSDKCIETSEGILENVPYQMDK
eukprot:CAMPEP_0178924060 /NCGR_PEP_ID=MMETSP0786-20121207/17109_1 /TAXON_ID=186022 /ORGANISM="Thalassionema frauenfeldii, Strain CCMP 1798" /LENGTH=247 /DNA_ID=CAMNT_0020598713 /DNA_START=250 /DNA_END=993 /DNA_ORIENTATION=+